MNIKSTTPVVLPIGLLEDAKYFYVQLKTVILTTSFRLLKMGILVYLGMKSRETLGTNRYTMTFTPLGKDEDSLGPVTLKNKKNLTRNKTKQKHEYHAPSPARFHATSCEG